MLAEQTLSSHYDVVIAGGGMVGASLALQLSCYSRQQLKVLVVESFAPSEDAPASDKTQPSYSPSFDARSTALSYGSRLILQSLGLWDLLSQHIAAINSIHVSSRGSFGSATMNTEQVDWPALGYVVDNVWLGKVLLSALKQHSNVHYVAPAKMMAINPQQGHVIFDIEQQSKTKKVQAQLAVIADGANSQLREQLGIDVRVNDYRQSALIANVSFEKTHNGCAYERFTDQGPIALLPLNDSAQGEHRAALVWSLSHGKGHYLSQCEQQEFLQSLQQRFGHRQGHFTRVGDRFLYPLKRIESCEQVRSGIVVMGNAAHSIHPVAGQGFNLALRDCARLSRLLTDAFSMQQCLGDLSLLQSYESQQAFDQAKTIIFSDQLPALFSSKQLPLSILRAIGLGVLDISPTAKLAFVHHAAGMHDGAALG
jgi:2-octaprenyl-6-methoxyphenol hydroxylase